MQTQGTGDGHHESGFRIQDSGTGSSERRTETDAEVAGQPEKYLRHEASFHIVDGIMQFPECPS
ncbi:GD22309 [Drosophila simulans]|uniref:GD22309 n=1 Tax=Drosophila simulans TaxID=7240 RepID=B4Q8C2_DROSI|nr:GD22309 [Drosophila simulans]